ncbi:MAG: hypothetical protein KJ077_00225 [Anaerolineae bacterium]|nr:hypothetical protein [Anaerolineae bacterium]
MTIIPDAVWVYLCSPLGPHLTSDMVVVLCYPLPARLQFLISDNEPQFRADAFARLARTTNFIQV